MTKIYYLDALSGAGKTYAEIRYAHRQALLGRKVLIVQPTKNLISKTVANELQGLFPDDRWRAIHGDTDPGRVAKEIVRHFEETAPGGEIVFITHSAFLRLPYLHRRQSWIVICDEIPDVDVYAEFNLPQNHALLTPHLRLERFDNQYGIAFAKDDASAALLRRIAQNADGDDVWRQFEGFAHRVTSDHWTVHVLDYQFRNLIDGQGDQRKLITYSLLRPTIFDGFVKVIVAGACFKESLLYRMWLAQGLRFSPFNAKLRYDRHQNGHLVTIGYVAEQDWSKDLRDKRLDGVRLFDKIVEEVEMEFGDQPFTWMANKDERDDVFDKSIATRLPNTPHGLNEYQHIDNCVVLSALNPPPAHFSFMAARGVCGDELRTAHYRQAAYQAVMRGSIRDPQSTAPKTVIVMDRSTAVWLADLFPGAKVAHLDGGFVIPPKKVGGRPRVHADSAARTARYRRDQERKLKAELDFVNGTDVIFGPYPNLAKEVWSQMSEAKGLCDETTLIRGSFVTYGTAYGSLYDKEPLDHVGLSDDDSFIAGLRGFHERVLLDKADSGLFSPAHFDPDMTGETSRGLANVRHLRGVWLDNDGGDLTHLEFVRLLPRLRMVVFNTYSSTPAKPRWRAFIPTTHAMSTEVHRLVMRQIMDTVKKAGFHDQKALNKNPRIKSRKSHGFDLSKLVASSLFYLPCQAKHPGASFFEDHNGGDRQALNPFEWIEGLTIHDRPEPIMVPVVATTTGSPSQPPVPPAWTRAATSPSLAAIREQIVAQQTGDTEDRRLVRRDAALDDWRRNGCGPHQGHDEFFRLAARLHHLGMDLSEIGSTLHQEATWAHSPKDRRKAISDILKSLRRGRSRGGS
jgi:hypothetical protein